MSSERHDILDDWLAQMPGELPPPELAAKICAAIRARRTAAKRLNARLHWAVSLSLTLGGGWILGPRLASVLPAVNLPPSAIPWLLASYETLQTDLTAWMDALAVSLTAAQRGLNTALGGLAWLGLLALGLASALAMAQLLPRKEM